MIDDEGGFRKNYEENIDTRDKVNRYLNALETNETQNSPLPQMSLSSLSTTDSANKQLISTTTTSVENEAKVKTLSTTSSSCISDEGCYGSSDFSSDSKQQRIQTKTMGQEQFIILNENFNSMIRQSQFAFSNPPSIRSYNLSRFEKIYNTEPVTLLSSSGSSALDRTLSPAPLLNPRQVVNSISGSYV